LLKTPRLRQLRERATLSQEDLAERSNVSRATIADLEGGKRSARPSTRRKLAEALGVRPDELSEDLLELTQQTEYALRAERDMLLEDRDRERQRAEGLERRLRRPTAGGGASYLGTREGLKTVVRCYQRMVLLTSSFLLKAILWMPMTGIADYEAIVR
jgi:transcriptional regulator with XRE-family HTH domain